MDTLFPITEQVQVRHKGTLWAVPVSKVKEYAIQICHYIIITSLVKHGSTDLPLHHHYIIGYCHRNHVEREEKKALQNAGINPQERVFTAEEVILTYSSCV